MVVWVLLGICSLPIAILCVMLFSRFLIESSGSWNKGYGEASFRICWVFIRAEGSGCFTGQDTRLGIKVGGKSLWKRVFSKPIWKSGLFVKKEKTKKRIKAPRPGPENLSLYGRTARRILERLEDPSFTLQGTFGFSDPSFTGQIAGMIYGLQGMIGGRYPWVACDIHPDFVDASQDIRTRLSFILRPCMLFWPFIAFLSEWLKRKK